ncbi:hypothetical protein T439DRAFT_335450 [Meredithblackwellia eburnea MCA 4105]
MAWLIHSPVELSGFGGAAVTNPEWSAEDVKKLKKRVAKFGENWKKVARKFPTRTKKACRKKFELLVAAKQERERSISQGTTNTGARPRWTPSEVENLKRLVSTHGSRNRLAWLPSEDDKLLQLRALGFSWRSCARELKRHPAGSCKGRGHTLRKNILDLKNPRSKNEDRDADQPNQLEPKSSSEAAKIEERLIGLSANPSSPASNSSANNDGSDASSDSNGDSDDEPGRVFSSSAKKKRMIQIPPSPNLSPTLNSPQSTALDSDMDVDAKPRPSIRDSSNDSCIEEVSIKEQKQGLDGYSSLEVEVPEDIEAKAVEREELDLHSFRLRELKLRRALFVATSEEEQGKIQNELKALNMEELEHLRGWQEACS